MTVSAWRIAVEAPEYGANDLHGIGAKLSGGRWNSQGRPVVYCASSIALAILEAVCHQRTGSLPFKRYLVRIDIPDSVWRASKTLHPPPAGWDAIPAGLSARLAGDAWLVSASCALLRVPSVVVPEEYNVLINPQHTDTARLSAATLRRWVYDPRLFR